MIILKVCKYKDFMIMETDMITLMLIESLPFQQLQLGEYQLLKSLHNLLHNNL